jgi:hypothetical protein
VVEVSNNPSGSKWYIWRFRWWRRVMGSLSGAGGSGNTPPVSPPQGNNGGKLHL